MGLLRLAHGCGGSKRPRSKICHTDSTMMKLGTVNTLAKEDPEKNINHVTHPLSHADISHHHVFHQKSRNTNTDSILVHNF